jgi:oxygen-dependent protoporphyrinogen oxidase
VRRRLGDEFLDYAIDPFVSGIYAGDPEQISVKAAFPKLHALEQRWGSLIRGQILGARERRRAKETAKNTAKSFSFLGGMQVLTDALAKAVGGVELQTRVDRTGARPARPVHRARRSAGAAGELARPPRAAGHGGRPAVAELVRPHAADAAAALDAIGYAPVATVASAYRSADLRHPLDGFGCLVPGLEKRRVLGVLFNSSMFEGRAPQGHALLTTFIGGRRQPDLPGMAEEQIAALAHAEHGALLGTRADPLWQVVTRWPRAIPQYTLGHLKRVARAQVLEQALPGRAPVRQLAGWRGGGRLRAQRPSGGAGRDRGPQAVRMTGAGP